MIDFQNVVLIQGTFWTFLYYAWNIQSINVLFICFETYPLSQISCPYMRERARAYRHPLPQWRFHRPTSFQSKSMSIFVILFFKVDNFTPGYNSLRMHVSKIRESAVKLGKIRTTRSARTAGLLPSFFRFSHYKVTLNSYTGTNPCANVYLQRTTKTADRSIPARRTWATTCVPVSLIFTVSDASHWRLTLLLGATNYNMVLRLQFRMEG